MRASPRKYRNKIVTDRDGTVFHSQRELARWRDLLLLQSAGKIRALQRQVPIALDVFYDNGREAKLVADFYYFDVDKGEWTFEDTKGFEAPLSKLKRAIAKRIGFEVMVTR